MLLNLFLPTYIDFLEGNTGSYVTDPSSNYAAEKSSWTFDYYY